MHRGIYTEAHYYSEKLIKKLAKLCSAKVSVVEAPSGYGKTTAVRDLLDSHLPQSTPVYWFTATEETPAAGFMRLFREINRIDSEAGQRLFLIGMPNAATVGEAAAALRSIYCNHETYLVIDNFQILQPFLLPSFFKAIIEHGGKGLHIILITQMLKKNMLMDIKGHEVLHITLADLRLNAKDIRRYFSLSGFNISMAEALNVEKHTEGWVIAVYLQLCAYREHGTFTDTTGILALMEHLVWERLDEKQQVFILRLSPFKTLTKQEIFALMDCETLSDDLKDVLEAPFIHYDQTEHRYELHSIFSELLIAKRKQKGAAFESDCFLRAACFFRDNGKTVEALDFYFRIRNYQGLLAMDFSGLILENIGDTPFVTIALDIAQNCPLAIKKDHILALLRVAWALFIAGKNAQFEDLMKELREMIDIKEACREDSVLLGEWLLLSSYLSFPCLPGMIATLKEAAPFFKGKCSQVILPTAPWCRGNHSQLDVFHFVPGETNREAELLEEYITLYSRLTGGHGSGADALFRAEVAHYRGDLQQAEVLAYKAIFLAESKQQSMVQLGAALHLAEIAVEKNDLEGWQNALASMERAASYPGQNNYVLRSAVDILRSLLLNELMHQTRIAEWLKTGDTEGKLLPAMQTNALFVRLSYLMHEGEFAKLAGIAEAGLKDLPPNAVLGDTLLSILTAVGYLSLGNAARAEELLEHAAQKALPDGFIYLFAVYYWTLQGLPENFIRKKYPQLLERFLEIKERFINGFTSLHNAMFRDGLPPDLTPREYEVAKLAAEGLRNSEIAQRLVITESTVRAHLRTVFEKLDIDRRAKLAEKLQA